MRRLEAMPVEAIVPPLSMARFAAGEEGFVQIAPAGEIMLPELVCHGEAVIQQPLNMPPQLPGFLQKVRHPGLGVARAKNAVCVAGGVAIAGERVLLESFSAPWEADYHNALVRDGDGWRLRDAAEITGALEGPVLFVDYQHNAFFGHFIADALSRCWAVGFCRGWLGADVRQALVSAPVPPFITAMLGALGIAAIALQPGQAMRCGELIVASKSFQIQEYTSPPAVRLWQSLRDVLAVRQGGPERVYVSRRLNPTRPLVEEALVEALFAQHGFTVFYPETHEIAVQMSVFAGAKLIAGCSGSNMFNIAFQRRAVGVLVIASPLLVHYSEHFLAAGGTARLTYFIGYVTDAQMAETPGYVHAAWHVDVPALADVVAGWVETA